MAPAHAAKVDMFLLSRCVVRYCRNTTVPWRSWERKHLGGVATKLCLLAAALLTHTCAVNEHVQHCVPHTKGLAWLSGSSVKQQLHVCRWGDLHAGPSLMEAVAATERLRSEALLQAAADASGSDEAPETAVTTISSLYPGAVGPLQLLNRQAGA